MAFHMEDRHPSTQHMLTMLTPNPNLKGKAKYIAVEAAKLTEDMVDSLPDSPELTAGLRKLLEAKDCFVRAHIFGNTVDYRDR